MLVRATAARTALLASGGALLPVHAACTATRVPPSTTLPAATIVVSPSLVARTRTFGGIKGTGLMSASEMQIVDLARKDADPQLVVHEMSRRLNRVDKLVKKAPYMGGAFIVMIIDEARAGMTELEECLERFPALPDDFKESVRDRIATNRQECKAVLYEADLL